MEPRFTHLRKTGMTMAQTSESTKNRKGSPARKPAAKSDREAMRHAFLTGYPGFIGKQLARQILDSRPRARLTILVQEKFKKDAQAYIQKMPAPHQARIHLVIGDVAKMDLGLSGPEIDDLTNSVTHVYHLAAVQHMSVSEQEAFRVNVGGTRNMLMLAREMTKLKRFSHFSSCYVSGDRIGVITEDELAQGQSFRNPYEKTKYEAERVVQNATGDLPISIFRPSIVIGHSETGEIDRFDGIYSLGILIVTSPISIPIPLPGEGFAPLNLVPVDYLTKATIELSTKKSTNGLTFHIVDPNPLSSRHVYDLIAKRAGKRLPRVGLSYSFARRLLRIPLIERFSRSQAQSLDYLNHLAIYNCANTLRHLQDSGILCPQFHSYADRVIDFVNRSIQRRQAARTLKPPVKDPYDS
jgi:thioester reductase-like protein